MEVILVGVAVFVVSALMIYMISVFGTKEKSYEEAIAEQKKRLEEEREKARSDKKAEKDKKKAKKTKDKPKEKPPPPTDHDVKEHKMVNLEIDPEIIEPLSDRPAKPAGKKKISKSILHNKDEKPLVAKETQEVIHHFVQPPKDDVELKHEHDKEAKEKQRAAKKAEKQRQETSKEMKVVEDVIVVERTKLTSATPPSVEQSSRKAKSAAGENAGVDTTKLIASVNAAPLNDNDTQTLIDILLNKQGGGSSIAAEWNKKSQKGDPVALLRKQLEEKERALQEEQQLAMSSSKQYKELKQDMMKEKARYTALERQYQEKIAAQTQEIQALHSRMQNTHDQQLADRSNMQARIQQLERQAGDQGRLKQLSDENQLLRETLERTKAEAIPQAEFNSLRQKVSIMENELSSNVIKLNSTEKSKKALEAKLGKMEDEVKKVKSSETDTEGMWSKRLDEVNQQLRKSEAEKSSLTNKLKAAEKDCSTVKARLQELDKALSGNDSASKELEGKLKQAEAARTNAESTLKTTEKKLSDMEQQKSALKQELEALKQDNRVLSEEIKTVKERPLGDGQEAPGKTEGAPNGDIHTEAAKNKILIVDHEKIVSEKEAEIKKLLEQVESQKKKNNELREKNWKAMDALEKAEKSASDKIQKAVRDFKDQSAVAVSEVEKKDKDVLQRLFPTIKPSDKLVHNEWMSDFEKQVSVHLTTLSNTSNNSAKSDAKVKELEGTVKTLQSQLEESKSTSSSQSAKLDSRVKELEAHNKKLQSQVEEQKSSSSSQIAQSESKVKELEENNQSLQAQVEEYKTNSSLQSAESEAKISELQENNKSLQIQYEDYKSSVTAEGTKSESRVKELEAKNKTLQSQVGELEKSNKKLQSQVEDQSSALSQNTSDGAVKDLQEVNRKLESQVEDYLTVLKTTETKLQQLENSVESEEKKWQEKTQALQLDLEQARQENASLKGEVVKAHETEEALTELDFAYRCLEKSVNQITEEMKAKVLSLQGQLKISEDKCSQLQSQVDEADSRISTLVVTLEQSKTDPAGGDDLQTQVTECKETIVKEQKKSKELASQIVKLNGIIKTGHDALIQEQELVKKLKQEIEDKEKHSGSSASKEMNELKAKLAEKEKLLDREVTSNKQLSQRLAQLGVMASSANDVGTSV